MSESGIDVRREASSEHLAPSIFVIVPAFREAGAVAAAVEKLGRFATRVVVVDDGSDDATARVARQAGATVLRHVVNRGQGAALRTGIRYALRSGASYIVTFDADGQHRVEDVSRLVAPLARGECDVVLGSRFLQRGTIPPLRRLVLKVGVLFTRMVSGIPVTDTHNGLRAFTRAAAEQLDLRLDRMAHASEILDEIARRKLRWVELPVEIDYTPYSRRKGQTSLGALGIIWDFLLGRWLR
ncbi:MAG: glycosyltransferase family 2 protein [Thermoanaerobaculia bacterium]